MEEQEYHNIIKNLKKSQELQRKIVEALPQKTTVHNVHFLIDTYGLYEGSRKFWGRFSSRKTHQAIQFIATRALEMLRTGYELYSPLSYPNFIREYQVGKICYDLGNDTNKIKEQLDKYEGILKCRFSYKYAAAPDNGEKEKFILKKITENELDDVYSNSLFSSLKHYPDFINYIKNSRFTKGNIQRGRLQVLIKDRKIKLNEKEVDAILIIEAMDILHSGEVQEIVLVSNDSDFNPLGNRFWGTETKFSQVDLGNIIKGDRIGKIEYMADQEILDSIKLNIILEELIYESELHESKIELKHEEIHKIKDFLNGRNS